MSRIQKTISPIDGSVYVERELASPEQIDQVLQTAVQAQTDWTHTSLDERATLCRALVQYLQDNVDVLAEELSWQMGRPIQYTPYEINGGLVERAEHMISIAHEALQDVATTQKNGFQRFIRREPLGTVLVLAPWNYPYLTSVNVVIPALMSGNSVIIKHSDQTPLVAERYVEAAKAVGVPEGVLQYLHMTHNDVATVVKDDRVDFVAFTGSVAGGRAVRQAASQRFVGTGMELGGKDPAYVRRDANLSFTIENVVDGAFFNSGQSCCAIERVYVQEQVYDDFIAGVVDLTQQYHLGHPLKDDVTLGPLVRTRAANFVRDQINAAVQQGAKTLIDPTQFAVNAPDTPYLAPQVLIDVNHTMDIMVEETFGPVIAIMKVKDDAEAITLMNDSKYGLTASIWTTDVEAAIHIGDQVSTGTWFMNRCDYLDPELAWTGVKASGYGATLSQLGYAHLTRPKSFHLRTIIG